eukprot:4785021-Amphidinium_carterae.1
MHHRWKITIALRSALHLAAACSYHRQCGEAFQLAMGSDERNVFQQFSADQYSAVRKRMIAARLLSRFCTSSHVSCSLLRSFQLQHGVHGEQSQFLVSSLHYGCQCCSSWAHLKKKFSEVELFMHTADISNPLMPQESSLVLCFWSQHYPRTSCSSPDQVAAEEISYQWAQCLALEFTEQVTCTYDCLVSFTARFTELGLAIRLLLAQLIC